MMKLAVFASGSGSNFQAIIEAIQAGELDGEAMLLVCDQPGARVLDRAKAAGVPVLQVTATDYQNKAAFETVILRKLMEYEVDFIILAGYMRLIGPVLLEAYQGRIINIHPSLLPAFPGLDAIGQALSAGVKITGVTIHYVDEGMDTGPIIAQAAVEIDEADTYEALQQKIQRLEHTLYPKTIQALITEKGGGKLLSEH